MNHNPKYKYDCYNCKFNWNCGYGCACVLKGLDNPPIPIQIEVNLVRLLDGSTIEFENIHEKEN